MKRQGLAAASVIIMGLIAGCGTSTSSVSSTTPATIAVSGKVADGYLVNATVFMDKNGNYQVDVGEPSAVTDQNGNYTLNVSPDDVGQYPIVAIAVKGQTTDLDNGQSVPNTYVMSLPAGSVSGAVSGFVSPMSTLIREKMEANPGMTVSEAVAELRSQMNMPSAVNPMADYVSMGASNDPNKVNYQLMHTAAQNMAALMAGQASQVVGTSGGTTVDVNRFRGMMGALNEQLPQVVASMQGGIAPSPGMMNQIASSITATVGSTPAYVVGMPFQNMSSLFPKSGTVRFWNMTGHVIPIGMMGGGSRNQGTGGTGTGAGGMMGGATGARSGGMMAKR